MCPETTPPEGGPSGGGIVGNGAGRAEADPLVRGIGLTRHFWDEQGVSIRWRGPWAEPRWAEATPPLTPAGVSTEVACFVAADRPAAASR